MAGGSYFKGWASTLPYIQAPNTSTPKQEVFIGHVISVDYETSYGKIIVRVVGNSKEEDDADIKVEAYPADQNIIKYPLPGELVVMIKGISVANKELNQYFYYLSAITSGNNIMFNSNPYIGQTVLEKTAHRIFTPNYETRFENKFVNKDKFIKSNGSLRERGPMKPREGDIILQGRFGGAFRFGNTGDNKDFPWYSEKYSPVGSPVLAMSAHKRETEDHIVEDINSDNSSIYFCSTQTVKIKMYTSKKLSTHRHKYDIDKNLTKEPEISKQFLATVYQAAPIGGFFNPGGGSGGVPGQNGNLPESSLKLIGIGNHKLEIAAADAWIAMANAARAAGVTPALTDSYRPYEVQNRIFDWDEYVRTGGSRTDTTPTKGATKRKIGTVDTAAAFPGTSNHGWGRAVDVDGAEFKKFIRNHGVEFGWSWYEGRSVNENWHFTYDPTKKDIWPA